MAQATVEQVGEELLLRIDPQTATELELQPGDKVDITRSSGREYLIRRFRPKYTLEELLAGCDPRAFEQTEEDREWFNSPPVGRELI